MKTEDVRLKIENGLKGLGKTQKSILLWLGDKEKLTTPSELRKRWPPTTELPNIDYRRLAAGLEIFEGYEQNSLKSLTAQYANVLSGVRESRESGFSPLALEIAIGKKELQQRLAEMPSSVSEDLAHAPFVSDSFFEVAEEKSIKGVEWDLKVLLGRPPTRSESASYAASLKGLEERELIKTYRNKGKGVRISHLELTMVGAIVSVKLRPL